MDYAIIKKWNRRAERARWASEYLRRAVERGSFRAASCAASLATGLENWLNANEPLTVTSYTDKD